MYDLVIVGAGLTAATLVASLREIFRICVVDCRSHLGGNCYDFQRDGTLIHQYGPHIFHSPSERITRFLESFTEWVPYTHTVTAEIFQLDKYRYVPFPYSKLTAEELGHKLSEHEIIELFYRGYSQKMWGKPWDDVPESVRARVPTNTSDRPAYYRDQFVALPRLGYTRIIENMLGGAELILGAPSDEWTRIPAKAVVYTGRPDQIPLPNELVTLGEHIKSLLEFRTLDIQFAPQGWSHDSVCLHACSMRREWTRKTCYRQMTGGGSELISTETPRQAEHSDPTPYYPVETVANHKKYEQLATLIAEHYPHLHLAGRLGSYRYFDMYHAVSQALKLAPKLLSQIS